MKAVINLLFMPLIFFCLATCNKEKCRCTRTTYNYDFQGFQIANDNGEVSCPSGIVEGSTIFSYDDFGRLTSETTMICD